ncbi:PELO [Symbiodinium necroappetens]|uniref:Eukaryotic peptide chain release factor subunit 1 n=1 Tax=Symbiodinium necroappetens TaxID=1628268 RepID=A0A813CCN3_9DINO|nr:PELO [Symbiodinium necroappetens]
MPNQPVPLDLAAWMQGPSPGAFARPQQATRGFAALAELLHCLSLLPAQSHKSAELAVAVSHLMTEFLGHMLNDYQQDVERRGAAPGKDVTGLIGRLPEPRALALAAAATAQLGSAGQEDEDLLHMLGSTVAGPKTSSALLALASEDELHDLKRAFQLSRSASTAGAEEAIAVEMQQRGLRAGIANFHLLTAVLAKDVHRVSLSLPKKRATTTNYDKALVRFFEQVYQGIKDHINLDLVKCVLMAGPGFVKDDFLGWMLQKATQSGDTQLLQKKSSFVSVHASCVHKQALKELLADEQVQKSIANTKAAAHLKALEEFYMMVQKEPDRVCYGPKQVHEAVEKCAVQTLMVVDSLFRNANMKLRRQYVEMVETARDQGASCQIFSSQHVSGEQLQQLSGIAGILRFPLPEIGDIDSDAGLSDAGAEEEKEKMPQEDADDFM